VVACTVPTAFASAAFVTGVTSGKLGLALKAGLIAAVTAAGRRINEYESSD